MPNDIFYFLQSDWLLQRAAFSDILTVVQMLLPETYFQNAILSFTSKQCCGLYKNAH